MLYTMPTDMMLRVQDILFLKEHVNVAIQGFTKIQGLKRQEKLKRVSVPFFVRVVFQVGSKLGQDPEKLPGVPLQIVHEGALGQDGGIVLEELLAAADHVIPEERDAVLHRGGDGDLTKSRAAGGQPLRVGAADVAGGGGVIILIIGSVVLASFSALICLVRAILASESHLSPS